MKQQLTADDTVAPRLAHKRCFYHYLHSLASVGADRGPHVTPPRQYELEYDIGIDGLFVAVSGLGLILQWTSLSLKHYRGFFASAARAPQRGGWGICYTNCKPETKKKVGFCRSRRTRLTFLHGNHQIRSYCDDHTPNQGIAAVTVCLYGRVRM